MLRQLKTIKAHVSTDAVGPEDHGRIMSLAEYRAAPTRPIPDLAVYDAFPYPPPPSWDDVVPVLVVEGISNRRAAKDTVRNRHLYWRVRGLREYWIVNPEKAPLAPTLIALRRKRGAEAWDERVVPFGRSYRSGALPGLSINLKQKTKEIGVRL
ncbi:MAG: hypothetical protein FLDDKLPJ_03703 [Phycisphaerae bacterium]|nr:hypothetical protein [Phycisphaerae bacterium]